MLYLPPGVAQGIVQEEELDRQEAVAVYGNRFLRAKDDRLSLVFAREGAIAPDLTPGRWHVERQNDGGIPHTYMPIAGPNGEYIEPSVDRIINVLNERDMWKSGAIDKINNHKKALREADRQTRQAVLDELRYEAEITAKVILGQSSAPKKASAARRAHKEAGVEHML